ncbi:hypothetical protein RRF57_011645 [Xylaria bambusicola]|uniref:Uncharacterized protein n=1 Tax=Xylaria bambusicola TaxID=326684 RepID=A0AAN7ZE77_9PEZI
MLMVYGFLVLDLGVSEELDNRLVGKRTRSADQNSRERPDSALKPRDRKIPTRGTVSKTHILQAKERP